MKKLVVLIAFVLGFSALGERRVSPVRITRVPSSTISEEKGFKIGGALGFDGIWGKTSSSDVLAKGLGYSLGLSAQTRLGNSFRLLFSPAYQYMRLGRPMDGSGQLQEPTPANLDQSVKSIGLTFLGSYEIERGNDPTALVWWFDLGTQYLLPLSASQTLSGSNVAFTANKNLLLVLGSTAEVRMGPTYDLCFSLHALYGLAGSSEGKIYGIRLLAGVTLRI